MAENCSLAGKDAGRGAVTFGSRHCLQFIQENDYPICGTAA